MPISRYDEARILFLRKGLVEIFFRVSWVFSSTFHLSGSSEMRAAEMLSFNLE